jgi:hypothetical protein
MAGPAFFTTADGIRFYERAGPSREIFSVDEYWTGDLLETDRVIDIGANVGAFCIRASRIAGKVFAVEPVMAARLQENISLNGADIRVLAAALGDGTPVTCTWDDISAGVPTYTLGAIREMAGGCDFLKCDCEGAEWTIGPKDLDGIRRIEMELHIPPISGPPSQALLDYIADRYDFTIERRPCHDVMGVMGVLHAELK